MPKTEKNTSRVKYTAFIDYKPAELKINKEWIIVYYVKNPITFNLDRFRMRVPVNPNRNHRLQYAKRIVQELNIKLAAGWSPFFQDESKVYKAFIGACDDFQKMILKQNKDGIMRPDTVRTYNSNMTLLKTFVAKKKPHLKFAFELNKTACVDYLDWIYMDRSSSPRTRNNHLTFLRLFGAWMLGKDYVKENPTTGIPQLSLGTKKRTIIPDRYKKKTFEAIREIGVGYACLCMTTYYCFIRNTELTKLRVWMVDIGKSTIFIPGDISKNKKDEYVTIPDALLKLLIVHINKADKNDFLFSKKDCMPGNKSLPLRTMANYWDRVKVSAKLPDNIHFYSLKDTGITDLLMSGVPAILVRDQARHYDIKITELYTPRGKGGVSEIKSANIAFC